MNGRDEPKSDAAVAARLRVAIDRLERRLTPEEIATVRSRLERQEAALQRLREFPLAHSDEPAESFNPSARACAELPTP